ncbi:MAG: hypothetical protein CO042_03790, partial [Parcubacteria group bacterium CG_4_9_14_0_2_um_filter_41_8]
MQNPTNPEQAPEQSPVGQLAGHIQGVVHEPRYWLFTVVLSVALSVIVGAGVYWYMLGQVDLVGITLSQRISELEARAMEQSTAQNEPSDNSDAADTEEISIADWKTYRSIYGFKIDYPVNYPFVFSLKEGEDFQGNPIKGITLLKTFARDAYTDIILEIRKSSKTAEELVADFQKPKQGADYFSNQEPEFLKIDQQKGYKFQSGEEGMPSYEIYVDGSNGVTYAIRYLYFSGGVQLEDGPYANSTAGDFGGEYVQQLIDQILSTFK